MPIKYTTRPPPVTNKAGELTTIIQKGTKSLSVNIVTATDGWRRVFGFPSQKLCDTVLNTVRMPNYAPNPATTTVAVAEMPHASPLDDRAYITIIELDKDGKETIRAMSRSTPDQLALSEPKTKATSKTVEDDE